jgi:NTP pyrophosphatase (non-canonical NTP hydrolase)
MGSSQTTASEEAWLKLKRNEMNKREYLLLYLTEEAAEVIQASSKCLRFTDGEVYGPEGLTNLEKLRIELRDFFTVIDELESTLGIVFDKAPCETKRAKMLHYMKYSMWQGVLS